MYAEKNKTYTVDRIGSKLDAIKQKMGKPYYSNNDVLLYNIDCVEFMNKVDAPIIDL